jgi:16S rRNA (cytosine967-C5)-methyltransferase
MNREQLLELFAEQGLIRTSPGRYAPDSLVLHNQRGAITVLPGFTEGIFQVQDQAAQLACHLLGPFKEKGRYLDGCAGLGGKTCAVASLLSPNASLYAVEPEQRRFRLLRENLQRQQLAERVTIMQQDLQEFAASKQLLFDEFDEFDEVDRFDGILIDAPCSGTGVIRKHPDIRWNRKPEDFVSHQKKQLELLRTAAGLLKPDGVLVYATCSLEPEENQQVIEQFLGSSGEFKLTGCRDFLPDSASLVVDKKGFFSPLPTEEIEGFFAARLVRMST